MLGAKDYTGWKWHLEDFLYSSGRYEKSIKALEERLNDISSKSCFIQLSESGGGYTLIWAEQILANKES
jgi:hypothetical protein